MGEVVIKVENIGKKYELMHRHKNEEDSLIAAFAGGLRGLLSGSSSSKTKEEFWALKDINFEIRRGDRVGVIGRNGAGKSTLLKILSRIVKPTTGQMSYEGRLAGLLEVGTGFHAELTGRENIYLNGSILGMSRREIDAKFDEIVAFSEVENFLDTPVKRYSSGMYVRLAFAVAAHLDSDILIVDEVLAVGDAAFQEKCIGKINASSADGKTVLFVSHNIGQVAALCNRGIYLEKGQVKFDGSIGSAIDLYLNKNKGANGAETRFDEKEGDYVLQSLRMENQEAQAVSQFKHDETYTLAVTIRCRRKINDVLLAVLINDNQGKRLVTLQLQLSDKLSAGETREFRAEMPAHYLMPGDYTITLAIHIPNVQLFDEHVNLPGFRIVDNGSEFYKYSGDLGYVFPKNKWSW